MVRSSTPLLFVVFLACRLTVPVSADDAKKPATADETNRPRLVLQGRPGVPDAIAISPNGKQVLTRGQLWDVTTGRQLRTFSGHRPGGVTSDEDEPWFWVASVAFSTDGTRALTGGDDQTARVWDVATGKELLQIKCPADKKDDAFMTTERVLSVAFSRDGKQILTGCGKIARVWDAATGKELVQLTGHTEPVTCVMFSPDGKQAFTGANDRTARVWNAVTGKELFPLKGHRPFATVRGAYSPDGTRILTADGSGAARLWDAANGKELLTLGPPRPKFGDGKEPETIEGVLATDVAFSPEGKESMSADRDGVTFFDTASGKKLRRVEDRDRIGQRAVLSADGKFILASGGVLNDGGVVTLLDSAAGQRVRQFRGYEGMWEPILSPDGRLFLTWDLTWNSGSTARLWDLAAGRQLLQFKGHREEGNGGEASSTVFSPDSKKLFMVSGNAGQPDGQLAQMWDLATGKELCRLKGLTGPTHAVFSPDGGQVLTVSAQSSYPDGRPALGSSSDTVARLWDAATGKELRQFKGHAKGITALAFSPDGKQVATGSSDGTARLWDATSGKAIWELTGHFSRITSVAFSWDSKEVVTGSSDHTARIWDATTGKSRITLQGEQRFVKPGEDLTLLDWVHIDTVAFSPDGKLILTGGDQATRLWDAASGKQVQKLSIPGKSSVAFRPDGKLATIAGKSTTRLWNVADGSELCAIVCLQDGSWVVVAPDGRFDADPLEEITGLCWVMPDDPLTPLSLDTFMRDYYEPKLLMRILAGEKFKSIRSVAELNRVQPFVQVAKVEAQPDRPDEVNVTVEVTGRAGTFARAGRPVQLASGAFDLHLFRDGRLVARHPTEDGEVRLDPKTGRATIRFEHIRLPRRAGQTDVEFSAYAFNGDRVKSETHRLKHQRPASLAPRKGTAYVVCVGVNAFDDPKWDLKFAAPDARVMAAALRDVLTKSDGYERVVVVPLVSDSRREDGKRVIGENTATKENLRAVLAILAGQKADARLLKAVPAATNLAAARPEDLVLITFSTHGHNGTNGRFYLVPSDIGADHNGQVTDELLRRSISTDDLSSWLRGVDAGEMVMVVDACHSAGSVEQDGFKPGPMGSRGLGQLAYDKRMRILAASQSADVAFEDPRIGHGLLTYALCQNGLKEGLADFEPVDKRITLGEWLRYGVKRVPELAEEIASGKVRASSVTGRALRKVGGKQTVAQLPSLFDFTKGADGVTVCGPADTPNPGPKKE